MAKYTVISQRPTVAIDRAGFPQPSVEITFEWGNGFTGSVIIAQSGVTKEDIIAKIEKYIDTFDLSS